MNRIGTKFSALAMALAVGPILVAQSTSGTLTGVVRDSKGAPLGGATVTLSSTALFQPKTVITNDKGEYRVSLLPPGDFKISARKDGYLQAAVADKRIGLGVSALQNFELKIIQQASAVVEVIATSSSAVDKADTKAATNVSFEELSVLPTTDRGFSGSLQMAPGVVTNAGGGVTIRGGQQNQTQFSVNGADVKDPVQNSVTSTAFVEDNIEDVQVILSPLNARFGRTMGGSVNAVTKSGSDTFHGSLRSDFYRNTWAGITNDYHSIPIPGSSGSASSVTDDLQRSWTVTVNGPIVPGRLWFSTAALMAPTAKQDLSIPLFYSGSTHPVYSGIPAVDAQLLAGPGNGYVFTTFDRGDAYTREDKHTYYEGKVTGAITPDQTLDLSYSRDSLKLTHRDPFTGGLISRLPAVMGGTQEDLAQAWTVNYKGVLASDLLVEMRASRRDNHTMWPQGDPNYPNNGSEVYVYQGKGGTGGRAGFSAPFNTGFPSTEEKRDNRSGNLNVQWLPEAHTFDFGIDYYEAIYKPNSQGETGFVRLGGAFYNPTTNAYLFPTINYTGKYGQDAAGLRGPSASFIKYSGPTGPVKSSDTGLYANDQWTLNNHWNFMLGLRADFSKCTDTDGATIGKKTFISPRFQASYDLKGDSGHVFKVTAARYFSDFNVSFLSAFSKTPQSRGTSLGWSANPDAPGQGADAGLQWITYAQAVNSANYQNVITFQDTSVTNHVDPNLTAPHADELTLSYVRTWSSGTYMRFTYVHKIFANDWAFQQEDAPAYLVQVSDPTGKLPAPNNVATNWKTNIFNSTDLTRKYDGLELEWASQLSAIWSMRGNLTYGSLKGNTNGGDNGSNSFSDYLNTNTGSSYYFNRSVLLNAGFQQNDFSPTGSLISDQTLRGTLALSATLPAGKGHISYSLLLTYNSGNHWDLKAPYANPDPGWTPTTPNTANFPSAIFFRYWGQQRSQYSYNDMYFLDANVSWDIPLNISRASFIGNFKIFNVLNWHQSYGFNTNMYSFTTGWPLPVGDYSQTNGGPGYGPGGFGTTEPGTGNTNSGTGTNYWQNGRTITASIGFKF